MITIQFELSLNLKLLKSVWAEFTCLSLILSLSADRGYVYLWPLGATNVSSLLHRNVELQVELDAHPAPTVLWTKDNQSITRDAALIRTTHLTGSRCVKSHLTGNI